MKPSTMRVDHPGNICILKNEHIANLRTLSDYSFFVDNSVGGVTEGPHLVIVGAGCKTTRQLQFGL